MNNEFEQFVPKGTDWYERRGQYIGRGGIFSETLGKRIEGEFTVGWNDGGNCDIQCVPENLSFSELARVTNDFDEFRDLIVTAEDGEFTASQCYIHGTNFNFNFGAASGSTLTFSALAAMFRRSGSSQPTVWNCSLTNFVSSLLVAPEVYRRNPLSLFEIPVIPAADSSLGRVQLMQLGKTRAVAFGYADSLAFIEHLAEFDDIKSALERGESRNEVTSLMSGRIPDGMGISAEEVRAWFPTEILDALTLASGSKIGLGIIELRSKDRDLYERVHVAFADGRYISGHEAIGRYHSTNADSGLGRFLESVLHSSHESRKRFRLLSAAIDLAQEALQVPDLAFALMVRALDGLANNLSLTRSNLSNVLPADISEEVRAILSDAFSAIRQISPAGTTVDEIAKAKVVLSRIADRARSADSVEDKFSLSLGRVLTRYGLEDAGAMGMFYEKHPRKDGLTWGQVLDKYRAGTIHHGYIDYSAGVEIMDVVCVTRHLIDIGIRICLKEVGYQGTYNPLDMTTWRQNSVSWVRTDSDIRNFGYHGMTPKMFQFIDRDEQPRAETHANAVRPE